MLLTDSENGDATSKTAPIFNIHIARIVWMTVASITISNLMLERYQRKDCGKIADGMQAEKAAGSFPLFQGMGFPLHLIWGVKLVFFLSGVFLPPLPPQ